MRARSLVLAVVAVLCAALALGSTAPVGTLLAAVVVYWLAVVIAAVVVAVVLVLRFVLEGVDAFTGTDELKLLGIGLLVVVALAAVVGSVLAAIRLPRQRRRLEAQVLAETGARVVTSPDEHRRVHNILDALAIAADIPPPRFAVVDDPAPNSFAIGTRPSRTVVAVTTGAVDSLSRDELEAVLAYEVTRIGSWDVALSSWTVALTGAAIAALDDDVTKVFGVTPHWAARRLRRWAMRDAALERDRAAVRFTRNPAGLLRALEAVAANPLEVQRVSAATAPLWFEVPARVPGGDATLADRIAALRGMVA